MSTENNVPKVKTYVLLEHTKSSASVYVQVSKDKRVRIGDKRPVDHAFNQITFMDYEGKNRTIRLKLSCDEIYQDVQIKQHLIPANEKWTQEERDALRFTNGSLVTDNPVVQNFLETSPQYDKFWVPDEKGRVGRCASIKRPLYTLYDETVELAEEDRMFNLRLKAANKIGAINSLKEAQDLMIRLNGSFFKTPDNLLKCRSELIRYLDAANEEMLDRLLKDEITLDEEVTILIGRLVSQKQISFDKVKNQVVQMLPNGKTKNLKEISSDYDLEDRKQYFLDFLTSEDGKLMFNDLKKLVNVKK